jgi:hypothetical protein
MPVIDVTPSELATVAGRIEAALAVGDEVCSSHSGLRASAAAAGRGDAEGAIGSFLETWSYGLSCINGDARNLAHLLRVTGTAYEQAEQAIATAAAP